MIPRVIFLALFLSVSCSRFCNAEEANNCDVKLNETKATYGDPEEIKEVERQGAHFIVWKYSADRVKFTFAWGGKYDKCYGISEPMEEFELTEKGKEIRVRRAKKEKEIRMGRVKAENPKWSNKVCSAIVESKIFIGMTGEQVVASWGEPNNINRTITINVKHEQWIYAHHYLYFDNGILTTMQEFK
jgi:hypothetical protein